MIAVLYVGLVALVVAAFVGMFPLRRYQDRQWAYYVATRKMAGDFQRLAETIGAAFLPAMGRMVHAVADMQESLRKVEVVITGDASKFKTMLDRTAAAMRRIRDGQEVDQ